MVQVLVTGANGYIAAHILNYLLERGYEVVGAVRSESKATQLLTTINQTYKASLTFATVPEITQPGCWDAVIKSHSFKYIIHTASPYSTSVSGKDLLQPAIDGTRGLLKAVKEFGDTVERVVITSSFAAIVDTDKGIRQGKIYTSEDWSPITFEEASGDSWIVTYTGSKKFAEKAAWDFIETEKPNFDITVLAPPMVFGPVVHHIDSLSTANESTKYIWNLINGTLTDVPATGFWLYVDVRDIALAHVLAIEKPEAGNKRLLITAGNYSFQQIANTLREKFPEILERIPKGVPEVVFPEGGVYGGDNSPSEKILGIKYRSFEETVVDAAKCILGIEERLKAGN